jgi:hypothetical protein
LEPGGFKPLGQLDSRTCVQGLHRGDEGGEERGVEDHGPEGLLADEHRGVAVQVAFEKAKGLTPGFSLSGYPFAHPSTAQHGKPSAGDTWMQRVPRHTRAQPRLVEDVKGREHRRGDQHAQPHGVERRAAGLHHHRGVAARQYIGM